MPNCTTCSGTGTCQNCKGAGRVECSTCNGAGTGNTRCQDCGGSGRDSEGQPCVLCNGTGQVSSACPSCNGRGNFECNQCYGSGKCKDCSGTGQGQERERSSFGLYAISSLLNLENESVTRYQAWAQQRTKGSPFADIEVIKFTRVSLDVTRIGLNEYHFGEISRRPAPPYRLDSIFQRNDSDTEDTFVYSNRKTSDVSIQFQSTKAVRSGTGFSMKIPLPIGEAGLNLSEEVSFSEVNTTSSKETQEWSWQQTFKIPARSKIEISVLLAQQYANIPISGIMRIVGALRVSGEARYPHLGHSGKGTFTDSVARFGELFSITPMQGITVIDANTIECPVDGVFDILYGASISIDKQQGPVNQVFQAL
jgi:hypothetical protein